MKNEKLLKRLYDLKESDNINMLKYNYLIIDIQEEINKESLPEGSSKKQYTAIKRFLNQKHIQSKPILTKTHLENNYQVFTDSYMLFRFYNDSIIESLPSSKKMVSEGAKYPTTDRIIDPLKTASGRYEILTSTLKKDLLKADKIIVIQLSDNLKAGFEAKRLTNFITIMNYKNNDIIKFRYIQGEGVYIRPLYASISDKKEGIILPIRMEA